MATEFPLQSEQDSKYFSIGQEDVAVKGSLEGGYEHARPRTTRKPRKTFTTGFTKLTEAQRVQLESFFDAVGGYGDIDWSNPVTGEALVVRIQTWPTFQYVGAGGYHLYNHAKIVLKEV